MSLENAATPQIAILLATYNGERFLLDQIASLFAQKCADVHVYARDDGSSDETLMAIKQSLQKHSSRFTMLCDNEGPTGSAATNFFAMLAAIDLTNYDYVAFSDQDDIWLPTKLSRAVACIRGQEGGGYSSNLLAWNDQTNVTWMLNKSGEPKSLDYLFQGASAGCTYVLDQSSALLVQRRLGQLTEPYCQGISHDWVIYAICRSAGFAWFYDDEVHIRYRQHDTNVYGALPGVKGIMARIGMMRAGWYKAHILWLTNVIENHPAEMAILTAVRRGSFFDTLKLVYKAGHFRRIAADVWKLRLAFAAGLLR